MKLIHSTLMILAALCLADRAAADDPRPYVFVQGHSGSTQAVPEGRTIQVQLPVGAKPWSLDGDSRNVAVVQRSLFPSQGRIADSAAVQVFNLEVIENGPAFIVFTSYAAPASLPGFVGQGRFELSLK